MLNSSHLPILTPKVSPHILYLTLHPLSFFNSPRWREGLLSPQIRLREGKCIARSHSFFQLPEQVIFPSLSSVSASVKWE